MKEIKMKKVALLILAGMVLLLSACGVPTTAPSIEAPTTTFPTEIPPTSTPTEQPILTTHTFSVSVSPPGAGAVSPSDGQYKEGTQVTLTATPASDYIFDHWEGDASGTLATITITMNSDKSLIANLAPVSYSLTTSVSPLGSGTIIPSSGSYDSGTQVTLTATPSAGYQFSLWSGDVSGNSPTVTITMDSNKSFIAHFADITPPVISGVGISGIMEIRATIKWETDELATSQVEYGRSDAYGSIAVLYKQMNTSHSVSLSGLEPNTTYHFRVKSEDEVGNEVLSRDYTFVTLKPATEVGGIISSDITWTKADSPYVITSTVQIPSGVTLTIEPGVTISKPISGDMFLLMGTIRAHGTAQEPIVFDGGGNSTIVGTDPGHGNGDFEYCVFKNGYSLWDRWGKLNLRHSQIINLTRSRAIQLDNPSGESNIEYNKFVNTGGISSYANEYGINIRYNLFQRMISPIYNAGGGTRGTPNKMVVQFNSFVDIERIILSLESVFSPTIDATHNYWGTTDTAVIDLKIYDGHDDVRIGSYITYLPILTSPHPSTPTP